MNGVINITTKPASETRGTLMTVGAGNEDATVALRHGGGFGEAGHWRAYVLANTRGDSFRLTGEDATDAATGLRGGGRADWSVGVNQLTLQGDAFDNEVTINEDFSGSETRVTGGNVLGRWSRPLMNGQFEAQAYYDRFSREEPGTHEQTDTWDLTIQQGFTWNRHHFVLGAGHRTVRSEFVPAPGGAFLDPAERTLTLTNVFAQDQIQLTEGLTLTLGAKFEDNSFSGQEFLPSVRLGWQGASGDFLWGAVSRASRTPNRIERDLTLPGFLVGGDFQSETATAYEIGYRSNPTPRASFSIAAFYNVYDDLRTASLDPVTVFPLKLTNFGEGETWGIEAWGSFDVNDQWRLSAGASTLTKDFEVDPDGSDITGLASVGDDPDYQVMLRSQADLTDTIELDVRLRAVDALRDTDAYVEADVRLGWRLSDRLELSVAGQNLIEDRHVETGDPSRRRAFGRSVFASLRLGF